MASNRWWRLSACALLAAALSTTLSTGCDRVVVGAVRSVSATDGPKPPVADLLIEPQRFPARYPAVVLEGAEAARALQDIDGVPARAPVSPPECAPPPPTPHSAAVAEGVDDTTASRLIVVVTRPHPPLSRRTEQLERCASFTAGDGPDASTVTAALLPAPPVDVDDSYALDQTVDSQASVTRSLTLAAQIGDTRVIATWMHDGAAGTADTAALDTVFRDTVLKVSRNS